MKAITVDRLTRARATTRPVATDQGLMWMQLIAVMAMVLDHVNWFCFAKGGDPQSTVTAWMNDVGRMAFPLFALSFGVNLARVLSSPDSEARSRRMFHRLALAAVVAQLAYWPLRGYANPLNVMATFLLSAVVLRYWSRSTWHAHAIGRCLALATAVLLGAFVEYWWFGIALIAASYGLVLTKSIWTATIVLLALGALCLLNRSPWALAAVPAFGLLRNIKWAPPRQRGWLYLIYPAHLIAILALVTALADR